MKNLTIAIIGGDRRQAYMADIFYNKGHRVLAYGLDPDWMNQTASADAVPKYPSVVLTETLEDAVKEADFIVGGTPFMMGEKLHCNKMSPGTDLMELMQILGEGKVLFGGLLPEELKRQAYNQNLRCHDFMEAEPVAVMGAVATAEGAILEAMQSRDTNIHLSESLVIGFGRCGKLLGEKLKGFSAQVTVCSRCENERTYARAYGMKAIDFGQLEQVLPRFEYIYNTVPALVLNRERLRRIHKDSVIVDIASGAGGVDKQEAERLGITLLHCLGIPGRYAPRSAAEVLADYCLQMSLPV